MVESLLRLIFLMPSILMTIVLLLFLPRVGESGHGGDQLEVIAPERVKFLLDNREKILFIDLRTAKEFKQKRLPGARSLPIAELEKRFGEIPKTGRVILYCACQPGEDSYAYFFLLDQGYLNVTVMEEGFPGWVKRKYAVETGRHN